MRRVAYTIPFLLSISLLGASCNAIFGMEPLETYEEATTTTDTEIPEKCNGAADLEGCVCETLSAVRDCYHGVPGPDSACDSPGTQQCLPDGVTKRWGPCEGGALPEASESCFDGLDNNCDGVVDEECQCTNEYNLCEDPATGQLYPANEYTFFTVPEKPVASDPFQVFVVTKEDVTMPRILFDSSCYGGGGLLGCAEVGAACDGWNVVRFQLKEKAGNHTIKLYIHDDDPPCDNAPVAATWSFEILP